MEHYEINTILRDVNNNCKIKTQFQNNNSIYMKCVAVKMR